MRIYNFDDLYGNGNTIAVMRQSIINGTFPQITIFSGVFGTGKSTSAEIAGLALTCPNQHEGNPCLACPSCRNTISALQSTAMSPRLVKINAGQRNTKTDVDDMIHNIFMVKSSEDRVVYVIEEAHSLLKTQQTALLEELDKIPKGVYVIFCTTKITSIIPELRNRAIEFNFARITNNEAKALLLSMCSKRAYHMDNETQQVIIKYAKGIPRQLVNLFNFVADNEYTKTTVAEFLGIVNEEEFIMLFEAMKNSDTYAYVKMVQDCINAHPVDVFVEQFKEFVLKIMFLLEADIAENLTPAEVSQVRNIFTGVDFMKIMLTVANINAGVSEADFKFIMLKIRQLFKNKTIASIITDSPVEAIKQQDATKRFEAERKTLEMNNTNKGAFTDLNIAFLNQFGGD